MIATARGAETHPFHLAASAQQRWRRFVFGGWFTAFCYRSLTWSGLRTGVRQEMDWETDRKGLEP
ncbi:hypothetical protein HOE425_320002 [Hoeflea sp. EC-HK425]|nr:hypothetical protein HOE425_320002 [Hoeflea sp. EC-HK425]